MNAIAKITCAAFATAIAVAVAVGCSVPVFTTPPTQKQVQAEKARAAANSLSFSENAEIENIKNRLTLTSQPGALGFIVLLTPMGQIVDYRTVKGKVSSGSKRLTSTWQKIDCDHGGQYGDGDCFVDAPGDEGTYGSSAEYIYFWDANGAYVQWAGPYYYSDRPIRTRGEPLISAVEASK